MADDKKEAVAPNIPRTETRQERFARVARKCGKKATK